MTPPIAPKHAHPITMHGHTRNDEYFWMRERDDPEVLKYLRAENEYFEQTLAHTRPLQAQLFSEMRARIKEPDSTVPERLGEYLYYRRYEAGLQYPIFCRKRGSLDGPEEILLDQNQLAEGHPFCSVSAFTVSPDATKLAYSVDLDGDEVYTLHVKNLVDGSHFPDTIAGIFGNVYASMGVEWANDNRTLFYVTLDESQRADKLFRHTLGSDRADDVLVVHEPDETFSVYCFKSRSARFLMIYYYSTLSQEVAFIAADHPQAAPQLIAARRPGHEYSATHHGDSFLIVTNKDAPNFRLMRAPIASPGEEHWREVLAHRADVLLEQVDAFADHIVLHERRNGLKQLRLSRADALEDARYVSFPDPTYEATAENNPQFESRAFRIKYSSLITPPTIVDVDMDNGTWQIMKVDEIASGYDQSRYVTSYIHAPASDDRQIPISLCHRRELALDGRNPLLIYGYGAYGASSDASFSANILSLLDRGFVFAVAHVRGGSELGRAWYDEGRLLNKRNSFTDFVACAEHLIRVGYTSTDKLGITGSSAGGLLIGASMIMRPDLFEAVICKVPFVDAITSMSDPTIPLTTLEYDQWGNPAESKEEYDYILSYSPYDNVHAVDYPHVLLTTGFNDPRVAYWEPAKFAARLRAKRTGDRVILLQTNFNAGHAGASGRYDFLQENVLDFAFLIDRLGARQTAD